MKQKIFFTLLLTLILYLCFSPEVKSEVLSLWNEGETKQRIMEFVEAVTNPDNPAYVSPEDRIAVFDNDGTLCVEKPNYIQIEYELNSIYRKAADNPYLRDIQPYKAVYTGDMDFLDNMDFEEMIYLLFNTHMGTPEEVYREDVKLFWEKELHPKFQQPYKNLAYLPMIELIKYLRENDFKVYIVTASETGFLRAISGDMYNIPPENIIGSFSLYDFEFYGEKTQIVRGNLICFNNGEKKPASIELFIGKKPLLACGNSNGDLAMFRYTDDREKPSLCILIHHDDGDREYSYEEDAEEILTVAGEKNWLIVSMKETFKKIFSF